MWGLPLEGLIFGRLTVKSFAGHNKHKHRMWNCSCACGGTTITSTGDLKSGKSKSCGCLKSEKTILRNLTHGDSGSLTHVTWKSMLNRCNNPKSKSYKDYGARGITVCDRWLHSYENFKTDMGPRLSKSLSIERLKNNEGYYPENCIWADAKTQNRNTRQNRIINTPKGAMCLAAVTEEFNICKSTLKSRLKKNLDPLKSTRR